jgi:regulation of enolase protein 1 (concanavalin A-like superfamily)
MVTGSPVRRVWYLSVLVALIGFLFPIQKAAVAQTWSLPTPWSAQDIGSPATAGSATFDQGTSTFNITAGGSDIGGRSDQFTFIYQQVTGDVEVIARVDSVTAADPWSESGVMIRGSLAANAAHGSALVSAGRGVAFQRRLNNGGSSATTFGPSVNAPYWVRLVRKGTTVTAYSSANGTTWSTISSRTIALGANAYVGIATTSHNTSATTTAAVSQVAVIPLSLPAPQQAADIGAPAIQGSTTYRQGAYSVHAGGADIGGSSDQFHFVYQPMSGDGEVVARVQSISNSDAAAKTGVMIRETLAPDSRHAFALVSVASGYAFQRRIDPGGVAQQTAGPAGAPPRWVRLVRVASRIDAYQSADGTTWGLMGSDAVPMVDTVYVGIATTSHNTSVATDAVLDNFKVTQSGSTANQPPSVAITSPANGSTFTAGTNITVNAAANDSDGTVSRVDFFAGTTQVGSAASAPYSATWSNVAAGTYSLTAKAVDNDGASTTAASISIQVSTASNQSPTVSLTAPANGAVSTAPATVSLAANASDPDGTIARVEFYNGTTLLNTDTTAPYSYSWTNVAAGTYSLTAKAYDLAGATAMSTAVTITVSGNTSTGLVGAYGLNEGTGTTVGDSSGVGVSGTLTNGTWTSGRYGQGLSFGGNGQVTIGDVDFNGPFTVMTWLQARSVHTSDCGAVVMKSYDYGIEICYGKLYAGVGANGTWSGAVLVPLTTADLNTWKHAAITYDGTSLSFYVDGTLKGTQNGTHVSTNNPLEFGRWNPPTSEYWDGLIDEVRLYNKALTQSEIQSAMNTAIGSGGGNQAPAITLTSPANGATFTAPASVTLSANASDADGTIAKVEFYNGTTLLNTDSAAPYSFAWSSVPAGTYTVKAMAYDNTGASNSSATSTITVNTSTTTPPTGVVFTASPDHATMVTSYELRIYASGADPNTATPIATSNLGKPTPDANNDITVDRAAFFSSLAPANYVAAVAAIGSGGSSISTGVTFIR